MDLRLPTTSLNSIGLPPLIVNKLSQCDLSSLYNDKSLRGYIPTKINHTEKMCTAIAAASKPMCPPPFCVRPTLQFSTCLLPPFPCSCQTTSTIWPNPVAPIGCPRANSPPEVLTGSLPPSHVPRSSMSPGPSPGAQKPRSS